MVVEISNAVVVISKGLVCIFDKTIFRLQVFERDRHMQSGTTRRGSLCYHRLSYLHRTHFCRNNIGVLKYH